VQFTSFAGKGPALEAVLRAAERHASVLGKQCAVYELCRKRARARGSSVTCWGGTRAHVGETLCSLRALQEKGPRSAVNRAA
jgi:hypothetical protein